MLFENKKQEVYTVNMHQIDLNRDVDNRRLQVDGIITLAWGYSAKWKNDRMPIAGTLLLDIFKTS